MLYVVLVSLLFIDHQPTVVEVPETVIVGRCGKACQRERRRREAEEKRRDRKDARDALAECHIWQPRLGLIVTVDRTDDDESGWDYDYLRPQLVPTEWARTENAWRHTGDARWWPDFDAAGTCSSVILPVDVWLRELEQTEEWNEQFEKRVVP